MSGTRVPFTNAMIFCAVIDAGTGFPVSNMQVELNLSTTKTNKITIRGFTLKDGSIESVASDWNDSFLQIDEIMLGGKWIIQNVSGDRTYSINERLWKCTDAKSFLSGYSRYAFKDVRLRQKMLKDHTEYSTVLYVSSARMLAVLNPIQEHISAYISGSRGFWERGSLIEITMTDSNFVEVENANLVLMPENDTLKMGILFRILDLAWDFRTELNVTNREFIDLTVPIMKEFSDRQIQEAMSILDATSSQGFDLRKQFEELGKAAEDYNQAINDFELANYTEGLDHARDGWTKYLSIYTQIREIHSNAFSWAITIVSILVFFSFTSARLIAGYKADLSKKLAPFIFLPFFLFFSLTQPYLKLFLLSPFVAIEKLDLVFFVNFLAILPWLFFVFILAITPRFRDLLWETLEISLRNMYRRRFRSLMTIFTITIVSASAMCVLTIAPYTPSISIPLRMAQPVVQRGLLVERYEILTPLPGTVTSPGQAPQVAQIQIPLPVSEAIWLTKQSWMDSYNVYGLKNVGITNITGQSMPKFSRFNLIVINPSFVRKYCLTVSGVSWLTDEDRGKVLIGSKIASVYHLSPGDEFLVEDRVFKVKDIFDEEQIVKGCKEINGDNFFLRVYDPITKAISGVSFIIGSMKDFSLNSFSIYKVSIIAGNNVAYSDSMLDEILQRGYSHEITTEYDVTRTYKIYTITDGQVTCKFYGVAELSIAGSWQMQAVLLFLSAAIVSLNVIASVNERRRVIQTIFATGATPLRIRMIFIAEALTFGLIGGIYGYVLMFLLVKIGNISLPDLIQENVLSSSPFLISLSTGILASIIGSLPVSAKAVLSAVPSKRILQKDKDIFTREEGRAIVDVPLRLQDSELESFSSFITDLERQLTTKRFYFGGIGILEVERIDEMESTTHILTMNYAAEKNAFYKTVISIQKSIEPKKIEVFICPLDAKKIVIKEWKTEHKITLSRFAAQLRSELIKYVGAKRNIP